MNQYRDLGMRKYLDGLAAEDDRGDAVSAVRGHDDQVAVFRLRGIDDRLEGMLMLNLDGLARDACCLRCTDHGAKSFLCMLVHACFVLSRRVLDHLRIDRERMKRRQDRQRGGFGAYPLGQGDAVLDSFPGELRPIRRYQDVGIHSLYTLITNLAPEHSKSHFARPTKNKRGNTIYGQQAHLIFQPREV
jgi:hypothetical protein